MNKQLLQLALDAAVKIDSELRAAWDARTLPACAISKAAIDGNQSVIEALRKELERVKVEMDAMEKDSERLNWMRDRLFEHKWNGVIGKGCAVQWQIAPDFRFKQRDLTDDSGIAAGDFRRAIDAAIAAQGGE